MKYYYTEYFTDKEPDKPHYWRHIGTYKGCIEDCKNHPEICRANICEYKTRKVVFEYKREN